MQLLYQDLMRSEKIETLIGQLSSREIINLSNMNGGFKEVLTGLVFGHAGERILYIAATDYQAQKIAREMEKILPQKVLYFPMEPIHDYFADVHSHEISHQRLDVFEKLLSDEKYVVVAGAETLLKKLMPRKRFESLVFSVALEDTADPVELMTRFYDLGYEAVSQVEAKGQVAHRGGIIDVFPPTGEQAYRIDFFGDTIESIRSFDPQTQLSTHNLEKAEILPGREIILDEDERSKVFRQIRKNYGDSLEYAALMERLSEDPTAHDETLFAFIKTDVTLLDYIGECLVIWDEPPRIKESEGVFQKKLFSDLETLMQDYLMLPEEKNKFYSFSKIEKAVEKLTQLKYHLFTSRGKKGITLDMGVKDNDSFLGQWPLFVAFIQKQLEKNAIIQLRARDEAGSQKIEKLLTEAEIYRFTKDVMPGIQLVIGEINSGFEMPEERLVCINQSEIIKESGRDKKRRKKKGRKIDSFTQLNQGDFVVHDTHGIGIYRGIEQLKIDETRKDLMVIEYANDARFYCPVDQMDAIQVYVGTGEKKPKINQLGTNDWSKSKSRVKAAVAEMADELITLYAQRQNLKGYAFGPDSNWQREFEESFPYEETNDQLQAVEEIKADMESTRPMDRLLCGGCWLRKDRGCAAGHLQSGDGRQTGGFSGADNDSGAAALSDCHGPV